MRVDETEAIDAEEVTGQDVRILNLQLEALDWKADLMQLATCVLRCASCPYELRKKALAAIAKVAPSPHTGEDVTTSGEQFDEHSKETRDQQEKEGCDGRIEEV